MAKSSKSTPAVRTSRSGKTQPSKVNDNVTEVETPAAKPAARAARPANGDWTPPRDEVARRAYEIFLQRGSVPGRDVEDWLEAERQVRASYGR